jgi:O-methyltransferase involved in polyketide biosynthesis
MCCDTNKIRVDLTGAPETMLATLYARALDADADQPILGDTYAKGLVARLDYDWPKTSAHFDLWTPQFLAVQEEAMVLHLGCGLNNRALRVRPEPGVEW